MYLRRVRRKDGLHFVLRQSYNKDGCWLHRDLLDLGSDPADCIEYPGGNAFCFSPELEEALSDKNVEYSTQELEEIFLPYLEPHIRRIIESFRGTGYKSGAGKGRSEDELRSQQERLHSFDKRRLHFLRCGRIDIGNLECRTWKFLNILLCKSRDEIEHVLECMESTLRPREIGSYLYTAFHLQTYFPKNLMKNHPGALDREKVDSYFLEEICSLNQDNGFFEGVDGRDVRILHPYLVKYVILYFDHGFHHAGPWSEYIEEFMRSRHFHKGVLARASMETAEACRILGVSTEEFSMMDRRALVRRFRAVAKRKHPDKGGGHEAFVKLTEAYEVLLAKK